MTAAFEPFLDCAIAGGRWVGNQKGSPSCLLGEELRAVGPGGRRSPGARRPHRRDEFLCASIFLEPLDALGGFLDESRQANHFGLGTRGLELVAQEGDAQADRVEQVVEFGGCVSSYLYDWMGFPRFLHVGTPYRHRRGLKHGT